LSAPYPRCGLQDFRPNATAEMKDPIVHNDPTVFVLDADRAACEAAKVVARQLHLHAEVYHGASDFFDACDPRRPGCVLVDVLMPGLEGTGAVERLSEKGICLPVVLLAARPQVSAAVRAIKAGAIQYLGKPWESEELADAIQEALVWDADNRRRLAYCAKVRRRLARLSAGERQVLQLLVDGQSNKGIAAELRVSVRTVEVRRARLMKKMRTQSLAELVRATVTVCGCLGDAQALAEKLG